MEGGSVCPLVKELGGEIAVGAMPDNELSERCPGMGRPLRCGDDTGLTGFVNASSW